jgi:8-oxo-dGTP diphosphatase
MKTIIVQKALVSDQSGRVLILKRSSNDAIRPEQWDLPGGSYDEGEDLLHTVVRETNEEAGLTIDLPQLVYAVTEAKLIENIVSLFYLAKTTETDVTLSDEHTEYKWLTLEEATKLFVHKKHLDFFTYVLAHELIDPTPQVQE